MTLDRTSRVVRYQTEDQEPVCLEVLLQGLGPLVVLIPSLGRGADDFEDLSRRLALSGYCAAAINPRGIGLSTGPEAKSLFEFAEDVAQTVRMLSPDAPAALIGHAFGNRVARATATRTPAVVSDLILLACGGQAAIPPHAALALRNVFDDSLSAEAHIEAVRTAFFAPGNDPEVWRGGWFPAVALAQQTALHATPAEDWTDGGQARIFVIQADNDQVASVANAEILRQRFPDRVTVSMLEDAGHAMLPEQPDRLASLVIGWLSGQRH